MTKMTRAISILILMVALITSQTFAVGAAQTPIKVLVDGKEIKMDVAPVIVDDRTLIPVRAVSEAIGGTVDWIASERKVLVNTPEYSMRATLVIDSKDVQVDNGSGFVTKQLDVPAKILDNRTMVPLRFLVENCKGLTIDWDGSNRIVRITTGSQVGFVEPKLQLVINPDEGTMAEIKLSNYTSLRDIDGKSYTYKVECISDSSKNIQKLDDGTGRLNNYDITKWRNIREYVFLWGYDSYGTPKDGQEATFKVTIKSPLGDQTRECTVKIKLVDYELHDNSMNIITDIN